jgi:SAM-dependent methyltransferase
MTEVPIALRTKLNLGCGLKQLPDHVNLDVVASVKPDVVHDLNRFPYPFADDRFDEIRAFDVIEHVADLPQVMREIWRMGRAGALVELTTPHFSCANSYIDPTHVRHLSSSSMDYFTAGHKFSFYGSEGFEVQAKQIIFQPTPVNRVVSRLAARWPEEYERRWAWMFPAWFLSFHLIVRK